MFCESGHVFCGTDGILSLFHVLRAQTRFRRYRMRRVPFSCFARSDLFLAVPRVSGPVFMFCAPTLVFGDTKGVGSRFNVLRVQTHFLRYRGHSVPFSCFTIPDSFSAVPRASGPVIKYCESGHVFCGTEGILSLFLVLRARNRFRRYQVRRVPISCFARSDSFLAVPRASRPIFMFCASRLVIRDTEGVRSHFNVLRFWTHFLRY
jgi:hypothetical protein